MIKIATPPAINAHAIGAIVSGSSKPSCFAVNPPTTVIATDAYLIRVITDPSTLKVKGYDSGVMSEVIAPGTVSDAEARDIVAYIKSLK